MSLEEIPIFIALALSLFGMASPTWYKLHRTMASIYLVIICFTQFYFKPPEISLEFLPYAGALLSGLSCIYLGFFCNIYPNNIAHKQGIIISIAAIAIMVLFISEIIASWYVGYVFNHIDKQHYFLMEIYSPLMLWSTILQSVILLAGGFDGFKGIIVMVTNWINTFLGHVVIDPYDSGSNSKFPKGGS